MKSQSTIFYLRGLNTKGDDRLRLGRLALGLMHSKWQVQLEARGFKLVPVLGRGGGPLATQTLLAKNFIREYLESHPQQHSLHLLSHSTGGLIARALVHELPDLKWKSIVTIATPHRGAKLAEFMQNIPHRRPRLNLWLQRLDYKIDEKLPAFRDLTPKALEPFNLKYPNRDGIAYASAVFGLPHRELSWPLRLLTQSVINGEFSMVSDGVVETDSQPWGEVIYEGALDHLNQIGYDVRLSPFQRNQARKQFADLIEKVSQFIEKAESKSSP